MEDTVLRKVTMRILPFLFLLYMLNILDRVNIGFARIQMVPGVVSESVYGFAVGIFYIGYFLFEVPSNLIMKRTGARRWIARIVITWGTVSTCMMFATSAWALYALRVLLGLAEAGFFPGIILYVSFWFPARQRARAVSRFMTASAFTGIIGGPLSGGIMTFLSGVGGLAGWQWLFLLEGVPTTMVGFWTLWYLTDYPAQAGWLTPLERSWLVERMNSEESARARQHGFTLLQSFTNPRMLLLCGVYFMVAASANCYGNYYPQVLKDSFQGFNEFQVGLLAMIPAAGAIVAMNLVSMSSDRGGERRFHFAVPAVVAAIGWTMVALHVLAQHDAPESFLTSPWFIIGGLVLANAGTMSTLAPFWSLPTSFLSGAAAAGGIAFINSVGNLGGFAGPIIISQVKSHQGNFTYGFLFLAAAMLCGAGMVLTARHDGETRTR